jgi:hypothetical protein
MGRGLSDHQKAALVLALGNRRDGKNTAVSDLSRTEIRSVLYGLRADWGIRNLVRAGVSESVAIAIWRDRAPGSRWTTPKSRSADVSITAMIHGLERRGLVRRVRIRTAGRVGVVLTASGLKVAEHLPPLARIVRDLWETKFRKRRASLARLTAC